MAKTTVNKVVWSCDRCGHTEDAEICGTDARFPESWGTIALKGKTQHLCKKCNKSLSDWFELNFAAQIVTQRGGIGT